MGESLLKKAARGRRFRWFICMIRYLIIPPAPPGNNPTTLEVHRSLTGLDCNFDCSYVEMGNPGLPHAVPPMDNLRDLDYKAALLDPGRALCFEPQRLKEGAIQMRTRATH